MGRRKRTEVRREEIAQAVLEVIASEGHEALSMVAIAKRIGVVPSALYRHFPSRDDMIIAAMHLHKDERLGELNRIMGAHERVLPAYAEFISQVPHFVGQTAALPRISFGILPNASERLRNEAKALFNGLIGKIAEDMERAQKLGEIDAQVNCRTAAMAIWGVLVTAVVRLNLFGTEFDAERHVKNGWELFLRAVQPVPQLTPAGSKRSKRSTAGVRK